MMNSAVPCLARLRGALALRGLRGTHHPLTPLLLLALTGACAAQAQAPARPPLAAANPAPLAGDPYQSLPWLDMRQAYLSQGPVEFDARVQVLGPAFAEDPMNVPISVRVDPALGAVQRVVVLVDRNPIRRVLEFQPLSALPSIAFRFKLEQASPVRAAVLTADGRWHVGSTWVDSAGGGCTVSGASRKDGSWVQTLGRVNGRLFSRTGDDDAPVSTPVSTPINGSATASAKAGASNTATRLRLQVMHPMDTGLVAGIPAFFVNRLSLRDGQGKELARMQAFEPVSENPVFSFDFAQAPVGSVSIVGTDNNGNRIASQVQ